MERRTLLSSLATVGTVAIAGCSNSSQPTSESAGESDPGEESRTTQTDVNVTEEGGTITYALTSLDDETDRVVVRAGTGREEEVVYTFEEVGDTYTINASKRHSVIAFKGEEEILLENVL